MQNQNFSKTLSTFKIIVLALALSVGLSYVSADWSAPPSTPPTCPTSNPACNTPINVGATDQVKTGGLTVGTLYLPGNNGASIVSGNTGGAGDYYGAVTIKGHNTYSTWSGIDFKNKAGVDQGVLMLNGYLDSSGAGKAMGYAGFLNPIYGSVGGSWKWYVDQDGNSVQPGTMRSNYVQINAGTPAAGKVLTATDANGNATWQTPAGGTHNAAAPVTFSVNDGGAGIGQSNCASGYAVTGIKMQNNVLTLYCSQL